MVDRWWKQTTVVNTDARDSHGTLPLGIPEQAPPVIPITLEEVTAIKHKLLLLSLTWKLTHPAAATA